MTRGLIGDARADVKAPDAATIKRGSRPVLSCLVDLSQRVVTAPPWWRRDLTRRIFFLVFSRSHAASVRRGSKAPGLFFLFREILFREIRSERGCTGHITFGDVAAMSDLPRSSTARPAYAIYPYEPQPGRGATLAHPRRRALDCAGLWRQARRGAMVNRSMMLTVLVKGHRPTCDDGCRIADAVAEKCPRPAHSIPNDPPRLVGSPR